MRRSRIRNNVVIAALLLVAWESGLGSWVLTRAQAQPSTPRLLVILVADQFRADYLDRYQHRWRLGFRTLLDEGARFTRAAYPYFSTSTCGGHTTIATGALPRTHGIIQNRWWQRDEKLVVNCMEDASVAHVSYGAPAPSGSSPARILVPTLADELRTQRPGSRVVALSLKARGAIPLAGKAGDAVVWFDEPGLAFVTSRAFAAEPVPAVRAFIARDPPERDLGRSWTLRDADETYRYTDFGMGERPKAGWSALFPHALLGKTKAIDGRFFGRWQQTPFADAYLGRMADALIDDFQLGQRGVTDYLAISFSALDLLGHDFGPESREVEDLLIRLDATLGVVLQKLDARLGRDNYVVALTADHGVASIPEQTGGGRIANEDIHQLLERVLTDRWGAPTQPPYVAYVGGGAVYFSDGVFDRLQADAAAMQAVTRALLSVPGMMRVLRSDQLSERRPDALVTAAAGGYTPARSGDLLLVPERKWVIELRDENDATTHGTFYDYDRDVPLLLRGHRVRRGRYAAPASPADIAPTLAHLAGVTLQNAEGRVLREAIR
jgi:predicted AlkP superfamily pyrophosphatase or phosphodiesterase